MSPHFFFFFFLQNDEGPPGLASVSHPSRRAQEPGFGSRSRGPAPRLAPLSAHPAGCLRFSPGYQRHRSPARATSLGELLGSQAPRPNGLRVSPLSSALLLYNFSGPRYLLALSLRARLLHAHEGQSIWLSPPRCASLTHQSVPTKGPETGTPALPGIKTSDSNSQNPSREPNF